MENLVISKKSLQGHQILTIRISHEAVNELDEIAAVSNRSRNEIINILLDFAIKHAEIK
ncbi:MAG: ribbon-helix-helix protein, CopG family [Clostridia bacterium]|nr:ribbon-helix-helix protein, CopG family [Clostridia bacterium]